MQQSILIQFPRHLFWDVDPCLLDTKTDMDFIIPRALLATTADSFDQDIQRLEELYTPHDIVHALRHTKERISNKVCRMVAHHYHLPSFSRFQQ